MIYNSTVTTTSPGIGPYISDCVLIRNTLFTYSSLSLIGLAIAIIMSFLEKRRNFKRDICFGRPGVLIPINLINGDKYVLSHSAAFGCTVGNIFFIFAQTVLGLGIDFGNAWLNSFAVFYQMMAVGLQYYPIFGCVEYGSRNLYAPVIGFLYALLVFSLHIYYIKACHTLVLLNILVLLPVLVCLMYLVILFARNILIALSTNLHRKYGSLRCWKTLGNVMRLEFDAESDIQMFTSRRNRLYVKILLSSTENSLHANETKSLKAKILTLLAKQKSCIQTELVQRTSNRIASIFVISIILLYQWFVLCVYATTKEQEAANTLKTSSKDEQFVSNHMKKFLQFLDALVGSYYAATFTAGIILIANMYKIYSSHRRHISRLMAGNNTFVPKKCWDMKPNLILARNIIYPGLQIGHIVWGFLLNFIVIGIFCLLISLLIIIPEVLTYILQHLLPPIVVALIVYISIICVSSCFLQSDNIEKNGVSKSRKILALTNWRAYQNFTYFMFFFYIIVGVFSCLRRNLVSAAVGFYYLARLDKCILIPGLEQFDISYMAYVAFLRVQVSHSNPIVMTFCELLVRRINALQPNNTGQLSTVSIEDGKRNQKTKSLARRRWFKAVTLLRNPALICESKPQLLKKTVSNQGIEENIHVTHYENITVYENNAI